MARKGPGIMDFSCDRNVEIHILYSPFLITGIVIVLNGLNGFIF